MIKQILICLLLTVFLLTGSLVQAQQPTKIARIGYLTGATPIGQAARIEAFRQGLRELGYVEGKNIIIDFRNTEGKTDRFAGVAAELVRLKVDIIVAAGGSAVVLAAKPATDTIPIVMTNPGDPIAIGVVASLARPRGKCYGANKLLYGVKWKTCGVVKGGSPQAHKSGGPLEPR